jgi:ABC-2 type transport system ATP-binding protein
VLAEVERVCDRVAILSRGRLVHLQNMDDLREARLARLRLAGETEPATCQLDAVPGVKLLARKDGELTLECRGDLRAMLQWVAAQRVEDFRLEPLGLGRIYQQFHAGGDGGTAGGEKP